MNSLTPLGIPALPPPSPDPSWRTAWDAALYGEAGFFRRESPRAHFRTSVHASPLFAQALLRLVRACDLDTVVDIGAGGGELLRTLADLAPDLDLLGVEVAPRPVDLPGSVDWTTALPTAVDGLVVANEWLDNIPCHIAEVAPDGHPHLLHVDPATGRESRGRRLDHSSVPASLAAWLERWWPLDGAEPGTRAEIGSSRDQAWSDVVSRVDRGLALAVDYGHTAADRPPLGSMASYRSGSRVEVLPDGSRDVTAHVAVDSVAQVTGAALVGQRTALRRLGVSGARPDLGLARTDPAGYVRALARATQAAELADPSGLGAFWWVVGAAGDVDPGLLTGPRD